MGIFRHDFINQKGQALLIVVLIMVVALTVSLSLVSRSIVDLKTSTDQSESQKALAAAEAGIEQAINNSTAISGKSLDNISYNAQINPVAASSYFLVNGGNLINKDEGAYIWLSTYNANNPFSDFWPKDGTQGNLRIYWGEDPDGCKDAALEIVVLSGTKANPSLIRYALDPCTQRASENNFLTTTSSATPHVISETTLISTKTFYFRSQNIPITRGFIAYVNPIYYPASIGAYPQNSPILPDQGSIITSTGNAGGAGSVSRKVTVYQGYPQLPINLFPYSILSP